MSLLVLTSLDEPNICNTCVSVCVCVLNPYTQLSQHFYCV